MNLTEHILTENDCWKAGRTIVPVGVMVHSTGVAQPNVDVFLNTWNRPGVEKCVHAFVSRDRVTQTLPWNWRGWHAGTPPGGGLSANNTHISFEILEPAGHTYEGGVMVGYDVEKNADYFADVYRNAVELTAMLCRQYGIDPEGGVVDHAEGYLRGIATNHTDVEQWFPKHGKSMDSFRTDVKTLLEGGEDHLTQEKFNEMFAVAMTAYRAEVNGRPASGWAREDWDKAVAAGLFDGTKPQAPLTREQAAVLLSRSAEKPGAGA